MTMHQLAVNIPAAPAYAYPICIDTGLLTQIDAWLPEANCLVIITDSKVKTRYATKLLQALKKRGKRVLLLTFPAGEPSKSQRVKQRLEQQMLHQQCGRDTVILALGGGVVGDLAGFIAATYMRGIPFVQLPTTLLAMVDSSVGGKTSIDTPQGKNLIGAFWQPQAVIADVSCLQTLPQKQLINGVIEAIKMFLTSDADSFYYAKEHLEAFLAGDIEITKNIIYRAVKIKADIVSKDEKENQLRMILNYGHTIGHALEQISRYKMLHGHAVAYGMLVEAKIAQLLGILSAENYQTIAMILGELGFIGKALKKFPVNKIIAATKLDKKVRTGKVYYILLKNLGAVHTEQDKIAHIVTDDVVQQAVENI